MQQIEFNQGFSHHECNAIKRSELLKSWLLKNSDLDTSCLLIYGAEYDEDTNVLNVLLARIHESREWRWSRNKNGINIVIERSRASVLVKAKLIGRDTYYYCFRKELNSATGNNETSLLSKYVEDQGSSKRTACSIIKEQFGLENVADDITFLTRVRPANNNSSFVRVYVAEVQVVKWVLDDPALEFVEPDCIKKFAAEQTDPFIKLACTFI